MESKFRKKSLSDLWDFYDCSLLPGFKVIIGTACERSFLEAQTYIRKLIVEKSVIEIHIKNIKEILK